MVGRYARARQIEAEMQRRRNPDGVKLISLNDAASWGVERLRAPIWANPFDHIKIDVFDKKPGPWIHLFAPFNAECNGRDPVDMLITQFGPDDLCYVPYTGPLSDSAEYRAEAAKFAGLLSPNGAVRQGLGVSQDDQDPLTAARKEGM
jgi:hypothetical protein